MNMSLVGRQLELTEAMKNHIEAAVESLKKYHLDIIATRVAVSADEKNGKKGFSVEFSINLPHKNTIVVKQKDKDVYAAVDVAIDRAQKVLRRHHDKVTEHKAIKVSEFANLNIPDTDTDVEADSEIDEIVPMELDLYKPLDIEEALDMLKESNKQFFIFNDKDDKTRVLYKRKDNKYGLY
ncbi:MAG: ribosome-associated translation inhibitor RaiA [Epsilonproteobacteria bacterium]|nr:ribosome-associated translation inhibitor RaiA [Campylobacterota bacterium]